MLHSLDPQTPISGVQSPRIRSGRPGSSLESPPILGTPVPPGQEDAHAASLGIVIKDFVRHGGGRKASKYRLQRFAAEAFPDHRGLAICCWKRTPDRPGVEVRGEPKEGGGFKTASFSGLAVCGSHLCPVCGPRIADLRRDEVAKIIDWATGQGLHPVMLTLTTANKSGDHLAPMADAQKAALRRLKNDRRYQKRKPDIEGVVSAFETTHGGNGWHPHIHLLLLVKARTMGKALRLVAGLRAAWVAAAKAEGLHAGRAGFKANAGEKAAQYMAKWDLAHEVASAPSKKGRDKGKTPGQLLRDAYEGDAQALVLWAEYARAMKGKSVLRFSPGLKEKAGIDEVSDEDAAKPDDKRQLIDIIPGDLWEEAKANGLDRDDLRRAAKQDGRAGIRAYLAALREAAAFHPLE